MSQDLKLRVVFDMVDRLTRPFKAAMSGSKGLSRAIAETKKQLSGLQQQRKAVDAFKALRAEMGGTATKLKNAQLELVRLKTRIREADEPTKRMRNELRRTAGAVVNLTQSQVRQRERLGELTTRMQDAGRGTRMLAQYEQSLRESIDRTNTSLAAQDRRLQSAASARERLGKSQGLAAGMAIGGYAAKSTGARMLGGVGSMLGEAKHAALEEARIRALGAGDATTRELIENARTHKAYGVSTTESLTLMRDAMTVLNDKHHAKEILPTLQDMKFSNQALYGAEHGEENEAKFMNMLKAIELRGGTNNAEAFKREANAVQKVIAATGGRVGGDQWMEFIQRGGVAAKLMKSDAFYYQMEPLIQEMGGSTAGNATMSAYQNLIEGRTTVRATRKLMSLDLLDPKKVEYDKSGQVKAFADGALKNAEQFKSSQFEWMQKTLLPELAKHGIASERDVLSAIGSIFTNRSAANLFSTMYMQRGAIEKSEALNKQAFGIEDGVKLAKDTPQGKEIELEKRNADLKQRLGQQILPTYNRTLELTASLLDRVSGFMERHQRAAKVLMISLAGLGALLGVGGVLTIGLASIIGPLAMARYGLTMLGIQGGTVTRALSASAGAFRALPRAASGFGAAGKAAQSAAARVRGAFSGAWQASSPRTAWTSLRGYLRSVAQQVPAAFRAARAEVRRWGTSAATAFKDGIIAAQRYTAQLWRLVAAQVAAARASAASRWAMARQYMARRGVSGIAADTVGGAFGLIKGGAKSAISGVTAALGGLAQMLLFVGRLALMNPIGIGIAVAALLVVRYWEPIKAFFSGVWQGLMEGVKPLAPVFTRVFGIIGTVFKPLMPVFDWLTDAIGGVWKWIKRLVGPVDSSKESLDGATNAGKGFGKWLAGIVVDVVQAGARFVEFGANLVSGLVNGIKSGFGSVKDAVTSLADSTVGWFKEKLGIHSPSRVFDMLGGFIGQGAAQGIDGERVRVAGAAAKLAGVAALSFGSLTSFGAPVIDARPTLMTARPPASSAAAAAGTNNYTININLGQGGQGASAAEIATAVRQGIEQHERERARRAGSSFSDRG